LLSLVLTSILSVAAYVFWSNAIVPAKREELMKDKQPGGQVESYLGGLEEGGGEEEEVGVGRNFQRWLFSDWLRAREGKGRRKKDRAIPGLKGKFNSGDNPVLVAAAGIIALGVADGVFGKVRDGFIP
jgi:hypothetical protein